MKTIKLFLLQVVTLLATVSLIAQTDLSGPAPMDPGIRTGKLANGLTYFIRHNEEPAKRASFYIIQNVGAILENDDQTGLAEGTGTAQIPQPEAQAES